MDQGVVTDGCSFPWFFRRIRPSADVRAMLMPSCHSHDPCGLLVLVILAPLGPKQRSDLALLAVAHAWRSRSARHCHASLDDVADPGLGLTVTHRQASDHEVFVIPNPWSDAPSMNVLHFDRDRGHRRGGGGRPTAVDRRSAEVLFVTPGDSPSGLGGRTCRRTHVPTPMFVTL